MITTNFLVPPRALIDQWWDEAKQNAKYDEPIGPLVATQAARWGADQELKACYEWVVRDWTDIQLADMLLAARRPKPTSLKEQALDAWDRLRNEAWCEEIDFDLDFVRRALEALPE